MNFFELHIGDYTEATAHLTFAEDAAYFRLLRKYYASEKSLPADIAAVQRLVGARERIERTAVESVLREFFTLADDGWHNNRADSEIARYLEKAPDREAKKLHEADRLQRHRQERAKLFDDLRNAGVSISWNAPIAEVRALHARHCSKPAAPPETGAATLQAGEPATPATHSQRLPSPQPPLPSPQCKNAATPPSSGEEGKAPIQIFDGVVFWRQTLKALWPGKACTEAEDVLTGRAIERIVSEGMCTAGELTFLTQQFQQQQIAEGNLGSKFVMRPSRHYGPERHWRGPFVITPTQAGKTDNPEAVSAWERLLASGGADRPPRVGIALAAIGGWPRVNERTTRETPHIRREFIAAFDQAGA